MKKGIMVALQYALFAALAAFFVWLSLKDMDKKSWGQLKDALDKADYWLLVPVLLFLLASHWLRALRWRQLIEPLGYEPSRMNCFLGVMIGYFVNLGAPRLGEVLKCTILARYEKIPADKLVGTIVAERAFDVVCLAIVFGLSFWLQFNVIHSLTTNSSLFHGGSGGHSSHLKWWILLAAVLLVAGFVIARRRWVVSRWTRIMHQVKAIVVNIFHGLTTVRSIRNKPLFFIYTIGIWCLYLLSTWFGFFAISATRSLSIIDALSVLAMGSVGMIISPGGIGAYALLVRETVSFYNIPALPFGQALGWLLWFGQFLSFILFGTVSFILLPRINKKRIVIATDEITTDHTAQDI
ncbi:MAG TPA: lysylphosphatidylglycerol synthase transmembrane domain-containing protein [Puia sp.]|nr:lysylphosphatidylglycerol synthase transmembrane domain-containing protein [Puia sp.]